jgi:DNA-binding NarL/FixJ family response regulator
MSRGTVLIACRDPEEAERLAREFASSPRALATTFSESIARMAEIEDLSAALLDADLVGREEARASRHGNVVWLAGTLRERWPRAEVVIVKAAEDPLANRAHEVGVPVLSRFMCQVNLRIIRERLEQRARTPAGPHGEALAQMRDAYGLTTAELRIVALRLRGMLQADIAKELGITRSTVKTHVRNILAKTGAEELRDLVRWIHAGQAARPRRDVTRWRAPRRSARR